MSALTLPAPATTAEPSSFSWFRDVLRSEFCKLASVRSTWWTLLTVLVANVVLAALAGALLVDRLSPARQASGDPIRISLIGMHVSQIAIGVLGVLVVTSEYSSGLIRTTLAAVPQRRTLLAAKALVFTGTALVVTTASSFAADLAFQTALPGSAMKVALGDPGVLRALVGGGLYLTVLGLLGLGLGAALRSSAGAIAALFGLLFVPNILLGMLPDSWQTTVGPYAPMNAGDAVYSQHTESGNLSAWAGFGVFSLYAAVALTAGFLLIRRRDA